MGAKTNIAWTDHTFNIAWGCSHYSSGCRNCYAERLAKRWGYDLWGYSGQRRVFGDAAGRLIVGGRRATS